jgi:hypothetical protein
MTVDAFVSYAGVDWPRVRPFCIALAADGKQLWIDSERIEVTAEWEDLVRSAIRSARVVVLALTPGWLNSGQCARELELARDAEKPVLAIILSDALTASALPRFLRDAAKAIVDGTGPLTHAITQIDAMLTSGAGPAPST